MKQALTLVLLAGLTGCYESQPYPDDVLVARATEACGDVGVFRYGYGFDRYTIRCYDGRYFHILTLEELK